MSRTFPLLIALALPALPAARAVAQAAQPVAVAAAPDTGGTPAAAPLPSSVAPQPASAPSAASAQPAASAAAQPAASPAAQPAGERGLVRPKSRAQLAAENSRGVRLIVSVDDRRLWLKDGATTVYTAPVAVGREVVLEYDGHSWDFTTPRGRRTVIGKERAPRWTPPMWHYVELAVANHLQIQQLQRGRRQPLPGGGWVEVRGNRVGKVDRDGSWHPVPEDEEVVFDDHLFIPPEGTVNRHLPGILGAYKLDLGGGIYLHGTPETESVGEAATHGCMRLHAEDLAWLYRNVRVGTPVYIY